MWSFDFTSLGKARSSKCILWLPHSKCMGKTFEDDN